MMIECKHCRRPISDHLISPLHLEGKQRGLQRCDPAETELPYGYNAGPAGTECVAPCLGARP